MAKHTPGPWKPFGGDGISCEVWGDGGTFAVCKVFSPHDAALIIAAPDLLAACEEALDERVLTVRGSFLTKSEADQGVESDWICGVLRAALKSARGEG